MNDGDRFVGDLRQIAIDPAVFRAYYKAHLNAVQNYLARRVPNAERVADLTADVFLAAIAAAPRYQASRGTPRGWTYGIARKVLIADLRRTERERRAIGPARFGRSAPVVPADPGLHVLIRVGVRKL